MFRLETLQIIILFLSNAVLDQNNNFFSIILFDLKKLTRAVSVLDQFMLTSTAKDSIEVKIAWMYTL